MRGASCFILVSCLWFEFQLGATLCTLSRLLASHSVALRVRVECVSLRRCLLEPHRRLLGDWGRSFRALPPVENKNASNKGGFQSETMCEARCIFADTTAAPRTQFPICCICITVVYPIQLRHFHFWKVPVDNPRVCLSRGEWCLVSGADTST